jgi:hypothetical protein
MHCLSRPIFQSDYLYDYASPTFKVELFKLSRIEQCEMAKLKLIVRMEAWLVSRHRLRMAVIAEVSLLPRQQSEGYFLAIAAGESFGCD